MEEAQGGKRNRETSKRPCKSVNSCQDLNQIKEATADRLTSLTRTWKCKDIRIVQVKRVDKVREEDGDCLRQNLMAIYSACSRGRVMLLLATGRALLTPPTTVIGKRSKGRFRPHLVGREKMHRKKICSLLQLSRIQRPSKNKVY